AESSSGGSPAAPSKPTVLGIIGQTHQNGAVKVKMEPFYEENGEFDLGPMANLAMDDIDSELSGTAGILVDSGNCSLTSFSPSSIGGMAPVGGAMMNLNKANKAIPANAASLATAAFLSDHLSYADGADNGEPDMLDNFLNSW